MNPFNQLEKVKTLLVDDDEFIRDSLRMVFDTKGCFLKTAETAEEGLQALEKEKFDIIISDLRLPGIDGLRFLRFAALIQTEPAKLLITAYRDDHVYFEALRIGVNEFIEKPFSVSAFVKSLAKLIKNDEKIRAV
jgi:DNA-binding NtrC family response regulator